MQTIYYVLIVLVLVIAGVSIFSAIFSQKKSQSLTQPLRKIPLEVNGHKFEVEVAESNLERQKGLMYRDQMDNDKGMLFIFDKTGLYPFWMMNTYIPLDIIWIDSDKKIVYISQNTPPCKNAVEAICKSVIPTATAKYVLEINGGEAEKLGIQTGDIVKF